MRLLLEKWSESDQDSAELITCYYNYFFVKSKNNMLGIIAEPRDEGGLAIVDSLGNTMGFIGSNTFHDDEMLNKSMEVISDGINKFPNRLDMRFGKIYGLGEFELWDEFTAEIVEAIHHSEKINYNWLWSYDEPKPNAETFFIDGLQNYINTLYNTQNDSLLKHMREISEAVLIYHPDHVVSMCNVGLTYVVTGKYDKGLKHLLDAEKVNPEDGIVLTNIARVYMLKEDNENAILYYQKAVNTGDQYTKQYAEDQLKLLKR